jgi:hypothetical protein
VRAAVAVVGCLLLGAGLSGCLDTKQPRRLSARQVVDQLLLESTDGGRTYTDDFGCVISEILTDARIVGASKAAGEVVVTNKAGTIGFRTPAARGTACQRHLADDLNSLGAGP